MWLVLKTLLPVMLQKSLIQKLLKALLLPLSLAVSLKPTETENYIPGKQPFL